MTEAAKLKPCAFCGGLNIAHFAGGAGRQFMCRGCYAVGPAAGPIEGRDAAETNELRTQEAARLWNTRFQAEGRQS